MTVNVKLSCSEALKGTFPWKCPSGINN